MLLRSVSSIKNHILEKKVSKILIELNTSFNVLEGTDSLWNRLIRENGDIFLLERVIIPYPIKDSIELLRNLPDAPSIIIFTEDEDIEDTGLLQASGADCVLNVNLDEELVKDALSNVIEKRNELEIERLSAQEVKEPRLSDIVASSPIMYDFMNVVKKVVNSDVSVLVLGETGVGKERLARAIHFESPRARGPFVAVNCGGLPESLLESELFGHEKGAFTGANRDRKGSFELAHDGTIFLDEIGDMPLHLQVKLLRVLQEKTIKRLGGENELKVNVRIIAATNHDLEEEASKNEFRKDLFYRLSVITLTIPPLRERKDDIEELVKNYIDIYRYRLNHDVTTITREALTLIQEYHWPGNIRELMNVVERAVLLCSDNKITIRDIAISNHKNDQVNEDGNVYESSFDTWSGKTHREIKDHILDNFEKKYLPYLLKQTKGRINEAAKMSGLQTRSIYEKMKKYGLKKEDYK